ncbi:hypothetical protein [Caenimonas sp. SL110]|uniref:hypothetical protein n=1 Tax=Caenimonas sp. SL110 TaxID=1450524 RepID=UPI000653C868|nr:hypothetical protein [Caenimonas sp. SL110]
MDWFERLTGFRELPYEATRAQLEIDGQQLRSLVNGKTYGIGHLELVSLRTLRDRVAGAGMEQGCVRVGAISGDIRALHRSPEFEGALFQVASQFNLLEMTSPHVTPEMGVTRYEHDRTQGPACAIAAGAATIYRNYFVPVGSATGQSSSHQLDGLSDLGHAFSVALRRPVETFWTMRNGYALCSRQGLQAIDGHLASIPGAERNALSGLLRIGLHWDVEVTDADGPSRPVVSQAYCSALPVAYSDISRPAWKAFASLVLEAAYEATVLAAILNARRGASNVVLLTRLGGGAFGNDDTWIDEAIRNALRLCAGHDLDVRLVSYGPPSRSSLHMVTEFS